MHIPLAGLLGMDGSTALVNEWVTAMRAAWAAHRAAAGTVFPDRDRQTRGEDRTA